jgi:signal peptidase I
VASPEFPDDRRAEPRRFGPADPEPVTRPFPRPVDPVRSDDGPAGERPRDPERPPSGHRASNAPAGTNRGGRGRKSSFWRELPILVVVALVLTFLIQTFLAKVYVIPSGSMETTLHGCSGCTNDRVLVDKITYRFGDPQPGDVVVFRGPDGWRNTEFTVEETANPVQRVLQGLGSLVGLAPPDEKDFVKRVIATGGQTVACCDPSNRVLVDGRPLDEPYVYYLPEAGSPQQAPFGPVAVPAGELWMMGDSRNNSADSRVPGHGAVPVANVIGQARVVLMPFSRFGTIPSVDPQTPALGMGAIDAGWGGALVALPAMVARRRRPNPAPRVRCGRRS